MLTLEDGKILVNIARESIKEEFTNEKYHVSDDIKKKYYEKKGVFVTLNLHDELRGCIGYTESILPLWETIQQAAKGAAFNDGRFRQLSEEEYKNIDVEISVLTNPKLIQAKIPIDYLKQIEIGRDGLIIEGKGFKGLLLPQVFTDFKVPDSREALRMTCEKAHLPKDDWQNLLEIKVYTFQCQVFSVKRVK